MAVAQQIGQLKQRVAHAGVPLADPAKLAEPVEKGKADADQRQGKLLRQIAGVRVSHQQIGGLVAQQLLEILKIPRHHLLDRQLAQAGVAGGGDQRAGTENISGIVGMGAASELAQVHLPGMAQISQLRDRLAHHLQATIPAVTVMGGSQPRVPGTLNLAFECIEGEAILLLMNQAGIAASSGSACTTGSLEPSHVLRAMGVPYTAAHGAIRFSFSRYNTEEEVDFVLEKLPPVISRLREISPYWKG